MHRALPPTHATARPLAAADIETMIENEVRMAALAEANAKKEAAAREKEEKRKRDREAETRKEAEKRRKAEMATKAAADERVLVMRKEAAAAFAAEAHRLEEEREEERALLAKRKLEEEERRIAAAEADRAKEASPSCRSQLAHSTRCVQYTVNGTVTRNAMVRRLRSRLRRRSWSGGCGSGR